MTICPHCGNDTEAQPTAINIPLDVTGCVPAPNFNIIVNTPTLAWNPPTVAWNPATVACSGSVSHWNSVCSGTAYISGIQPIITHIPRSIIGGE